MRDTPAFKRVEESLMKFSSVLECERLTNCLLPTMMIAVVYKLVWRDVYGSFFHGTTPFLVLLW